MTRSGHWPLLGLPSHGGRDSVKRRPNFRLLGRNHAQVQDHLRHRLGRPGHRRRGSRHRWRGRHRCPAPAAAGWGARPRPARGPGPLRQRRGDLPGEPQLRQPVRRVGQGRRAQGRRARERPGLPDHAGRAGRHAVRLPAPERREPDLADAAADHLLRPCARRAQQRLHQRAVHDRRLHRAAGHDLPRSGGLAPNGVLKGTGSPAAARATWSTASTRSSTSSTAASRTAT